MSLRKIKVVAATEFFILIKTKVFLLSLILVPAFSLGSGLLWRHLENRPDQKIRKFAVLDLSGDLFEPIRTKALGKKGAGFDPVLIPLSGGTVQELRDSALDQVRNGKLFAFLEIPSGLLEAHKTPAPSLMYYSDTPSYSDLPAWLSTVLNDELRRRRYGKLGLASSQVLEAERPVPFTDYRVAMQTPGSGAPSGTPVGMSEFLVPVASMLLLFLMVMLTAPQMMSSVIEEKMSRISEVLLASVTPFDLMIGKLVACCGASAVVGVIYLAAGLGLASLLGYSGLVSAQNILYFTVFLVLAVFLHGSMYMAVGAACSQPKDAQGMLAPLVLLTAAPMVAINVLMQDPSGLLAKSLSFFPLSAPFVMCFRLNSYPRPANGEIALSIAITLSATLICVWTASRIFRIGLLSQGKAPGLLRLFRWVFSD